HEGISIEQGGGEVVALPHAFREGGVTQREAQLVGNRNQRVPNHSERDGIDGTFLHREVSRAMSTMMCPSGLIRAASPAWITVVQSGSSTMAGPDMVAPLASPLRSMMSVSV